METLEKRIMDVEGAVKMAALTTKEVLTFDEAAIFTGLSKSYLYKLTSGQKIPHYKPSGKLCYFNREELQAWLLQNRVSTSDEIAEKAQTYCMKNKKGGAK
ncbi:AlpA family transcriptional regulator [Bacteroides sp. 224]|uniref:helix-turn-helix transcriptional regulator n=1 Tax=Bacteroides sp. 224 TaxID=2302936 RepID=UPI0013D2E620|nr:helix-turn-helix domain-containing protein [Bacteroides sp. 224]NDV63786.1 DNA-binding protein [Bacteroides sp. 224]